MTAALIGSRFSPELLPEACRVEPGSVFRALAAATEAHLVERTTGREYGFVHDRVRDALLAALPPSEIPELHQRIAEALERADERGPEGVYARARHYALGRIEQDPRRVYEAQLEAGQAALEASSTAFGGCGCGSATTRHSCAASASRGGARRSPAHGRLPTAKSSTRKRQPS